MQQHSAQLARRLGEFMRHNQMSQSEVAEKADVDQATVSRFLKKPPQRVTSASKRLCNYAEAMLSDVDPESKQSAHRAFDECWDKSAAHARTISKIIDAFVEFCHEAAEEDPSG